VAGGAVAGVLRTVGCAAGCIQKNLETGQFRRAELEGLIISLKNMSNLAPA
jgi:hypothetical protein